MIEANKLRKVADCKGRLKELVGDEGILQLAKDGVCPHYIITNPITKEETIWFVPSELNDWLDTNFVRYNEGYFSPKFNFHYFEKMECTALDAADIPDELHCIENLFRLPLQHILTPPGIYFLCKAKKIQYVGQSSNVAGRVITHLAEMKKEFDSVFFITCPINRLTELETALIRHFRPPLNMTSQVSPKGRDLPIVQSILKTASL